MHKSQDPNNFDGDVKSFESIVDNLRTLLKKAYSSAVKERNRANDLEKKLKKRGNQIGATEKLKRQPLIKHSKTQTNASDDAMMAKDEEIEELRSLQKMLEQINSENKETINNLRKDVRQLNLELGTQKFMTGNCDDLEEIHKIYNLELMKLDEELKELRANEDQWKEWPKLRKVYEGELENLHEQIEELQARAKDWKEKMIAYEMEIDRLNLELHRKKQPGNEDMLFNGSAGLLMAGNGISESDVDFIVQDNVNELRDSHVRELGAVIPFEVGMNKKGSEMKYSNLNACKSPFSEEYVKELEELNKKNMEEIKYLKDRIEENRDYEDEDIFEEVEELKSKHQEEVQRLNVEIAKLRSVENGDFWLEVEELKQEHEKQVNRLRDEIEELKIFEGSDISEEVEELKKHHFQEVESLRNEIEILRLNENGDIFEEVEKLKKNHSEEVACLKDEIMFLKNGAPGFSWIKNGKEIEDELNSLRSEVSSLKNTDREKEWMFLVDAKERELELSKKEIESLKDTINEINFVKWEETPEDIHSMVNEINRLNGVIQLLSQNYILASEFPNNEGQWPDSKSDALLDANISQGSVIKELQTLELVDDEAKRADIRMEYEEKMNSLKAEMFALKNIEKEQIWKNAQGHIDEEFEEIKKDFLAMTTSKNADEWARSMQLYDEIRRLKSELLAKKNKESTETGRLREEVRYLKQALSNLRKANDHINTTKYLGQVRKNSGETLHSTNPFYHTCKDEHSPKDMPSVKGNEDEETWNLEVRPLLEDIANLNNQVIQAEERLSSEKISLQKEIEELEKENSYLRKLIPKDAYDNMSQQDSKNTEDEKLTVIAQELSHVQQLQIEADEKAANYERQLEEERSRHSEELKKMADNLSSLKDSIDESEAAKAKSIEEREEIINNLKNSLDNVRQQHEQEIEDIGEMCKEKTDALDEKISDLKISLGTRENELAKRVREIEDLLDKIEELGKEIEQLKEENQNKTKEIENCEEQIKALRSELEEYKHTVKKTLSEKENTYCLYQEELGRVHIDLLRTKSSHEAFLKEMEETQNRYTEELALQKEKLERKFEVLIQELKRSHEDEIDQIRIEMLSAQDKFKEYINKKNRHLSDDSTESTDGNFAGLSRILSFDSNEKNMAESSNEKVSRSKSDSDIFSDEILSGNSDFQKPISVNQIGDLDCAVHTNNGQHSQRYTFMSRELSQEDAIIQNLEEIDIPESSRKDEKKFKNKKKIYKSKRKSRDLLPNFGASEETLDEVELTEKQKQCRQQ